MPHLPKFIGKRRNLEKIHRLVSWLILSFFKRNNTCGPGTVELPLAPLPKTVNLGGVFLKLLHRLVFLPALLLIVFVQFGPAARIRTTAFNGREVSVRHAEDGGGEGFNVVLGQGESLNLGELVLSPNVRDDLPQSLEGIVEFVHPLSFPLVALQPSQAPVFTTPRGFRSPGGGFRALVSPRLFAPRMFQKSVFALGSFLAHVVLVGDSPLAFHPFAFGLHCWGHQRHGVPLILHLTGGGFPQQPTGFARNSKGVGTSHGLPPLCFRPFFKQAWWWNQCQKYP